MAKPSWKMEVVRLVWAPGRARSQQVVILSLLGQDQTGLASLSSSCSRDFNKAFRPIQIVLELQVQCVRCKECRDGGEIFPLNP